MSEDDFNDFLLNLILVATERKSNSFANLMLNNILADARQLRLVQTHPAQNASASIGFYTCKMCTQFENSQICRSERTFRSDQGSNSNFVGILLKNWFGSFFKGVEYYFNEIKHKFLNF